MEANSGAGAVRQNLLDRLLHAVKQVQAHYGAKQEIATESDIRVSTLCTEWEAVLLHGQRKPKSRISMENRSVGSLWSVASLALDSQECQRFSSLEFIHSDLGRGRAWLRAAINERTLENYLHTVLGKEAELRSLYADNSFLLDQERSSMLPVMAAGLSAIIFSIPIDQAYLDAPTRWVEPPSQTIPTQPDFVSRMTQDNAESADEVIAVSAKEKKKKRKKSRPPADNDQSGGSNGGSPGRPRKEDSTEQSSFQELLIRTTRKETPPESVSPSVDPPHSQTISPPSEDPPHSQTISPPSEDPPDSQTISPPSVDPPNSQTISPPSVDPPHSQTIFPPFVDPPDQQVVPLGESVSSSSSRLSINEQELTPISATMVTPDLVTEAAVSVTALVLSATTGQPEQTAVIPAEGSSMTPDELREAVLALAKTKEQLEQNNSALVSQLAEVEESRSQLLVDLQAASNEMTALKEGQATQLQALERENDLLREQLRKYIALVRNNTEQGVPSQPAEQTSDKMAEMAEMYGELMELNERLHKTIAGRENAITTLVATIRGAGLPLPIPASSLPPQALKQQPLIDVWIPSAIKKGRGTDTHHVYQVFVRVRSEEWNVYRRYAEFREFHNQLSKIVSEIGAFNFPPRKTRNKTAQLVEERRLKLQEYLRLVFRHCSSHPARDGRPILPSDITKATLVHLFPFFREDLYVEPKTTPTNPSYSGL